MSKKRANDYENKYTLLKEIGEGGNAKVFESSLIHEPSKKVAFKKLIKLSTEKKSRFIDEIDVVNKHCIEIDGIIPVLDYSKENYWYTMPIATTIIEHIKGDNLSVQPIIEGVIQICITLSYLHNNGVSHRDIKPSNIYLYNNRFCLGDFGLVEFPDNSNNFTRSDKGLGAIFTIAPEMKRNPKDADGKKADVYSLAKTLWMFLTLDEKGFDGQYNFLDSTHGLHFYEKYKNVHLVELEELLIQATDNDPNNRPTIDEFKDELQNWVSVCNDKEAAQLSDWNFIKKHLFRGYSPESTSWNDKDEIVSVLNIVGSIPAYNHMLFSDGGGLDFTNAMSASEKDCIYIYAHGLCYLIKPKRLIFEGFKYYEWNYFLLELDSLDPILDKNKLFYEELVEDYPAHYVSAQYYQYGVYDYESGSELPVDSKLVCRYLKGKFLIVLKIGPYNSIESTYDGRHGDCSSVEFREYIGKIIEHECSEGKINTIFNQNPFKSDIYTDLIDSKDSGKPSPNKYVEENYTNWDFTDIVSKYEQKKSNILFYFKFKGIGSLTSQLFSKDNLYLSKDGFIKRLQNSDFDNIFWVSNREDAIEIINLLNGIVEKNCSNYDVTCLKFYYSFSVSIVRTGKPIHLFTKEEIMNLMVNADDRENNQLVIDENGFAKLIQNQGEGKLYPVSQETWCAGNRYVGKYSSLSDLDRSYISSLEGWLHFLKNGSRVFKDYCNMSSDPESLIGKIKEFY